MCIHTTRCNQCCVWQQDMIWHLHFHFLHFFLLSVLLPKQAISFSIWQKHDKQSISSEHGPMQPTQSQDALCQLLLYTGTNTLSELLKHFSNPLLSGLQKCIYNQRWKKVLSRDVKEVDEGRICYLWRCIILVDGAPVTFILLYNGHRTRWQETLPSIWFAVLQRISTLQ